MPIISPDRYLETPDGRVFTPERNARAWQQCRQDLLQALAHADCNTVLYLLIGAQGAGKSTWASAHGKQQPDSIVFDAILVQRAERAALLAAAAQAQVPAIAVWFQTSLAQCLARNAARAADQVANASGLRNVFAALEPPSLDEGFCRIVQVP